MHWYGGSIAEAVTLSKQKNAIFVVFVEGDNDLSSEMTSVLDDSAVQQRIADTTNFLAIRLKSGSSDYTHFAQIYQFVPVPSLFFIGRNGTPLEVVCAGVQPSNLASRIDRILEEHHKDKPAPASLSKDIKEQTVNLLSSESTPTPGGSKVPTTPAPTVPVTKNEPAERRPLLDCWPPPKSATMTGPAPPASGGLPRPLPEPSGPAAKIAKLDDQEVVCNDGVCVRRPRADGAGPSKSPDVVAQKEPEEKLEASESTISAEDKTERAKALIEAKRKEKEEKERQLEKEKEKVRRNLGQGVAELKRWQADQELKQIQEERKREKMENNLARQRILEQIAQDRAERRARDAVPAPAEAEPPMQAPATSGDGALQARVQFKLPDGSAHTRHFSADARLSDLHRYVADNLNLPTAQFSLWLAFPRRELTDSEATLRRLELAPSAALLVLPRRAAAAVARPTAVGNIIAFVSQLLSSVVLQPSHRLYAWLMSWVPPARAPPPPPPPSPAAEGTGPARDASPAAALRRRGNVHRLQGDRPDDDNNTWNGNSTQQM